MKFDGRILLCSYPSQNGRDGKKKKKQRYTLGQSTFNGLATFNGGITPGMMDQRHESK
jgi:hypothetical protein